MLRQLLIERGQKCVGCAERQDYVDALRRSLDAPVVAAHAVPLFLYNMPLYPHTTKSLHFVRRP